VPSAPFAYRQTFVLPAPVGEVWATLERVDTYQQWWPWLVGFELDGLSAGGTAACTVQAPLPYRLRFSVDLVAVEAGRLVDGVVSGDLAGPARMELAPSGTGTLATLAWQLEPHGRLVRLLGATARPALRWGHDRIVAAGLRQFVSGALGAPAARATTVDDRNTCG
jgi:hypothetical protein